MPLKMVPSLFFLSLWAAPAAAAPTPAAKIYGRDSTNEYTPLSTTCPSELVVRPAESLNSDEAQYIAARKTNADSALASWLAQQGSFSTASHPTVGFTSSGGGPRALFTTAGIVQAFDNRDSDLNTSGLYQGLTYEAGLSGGAWFLSSLAGNNWPTVSYLKTNLWEDAFQATLLLPANLLSIDDDLEYSRVSNDLEAKHEAGYNNTIVDAYGRLLSYQLLEGKDGGVSIHLSDLTSYSNFTAYNVPYPIITSVSANAYEGECSAQLDAVQYEFHPYEYGSWDSGVSAFAPTLYMGTIFDNGSPATADNCTVHYDNLGYILATSSDVFNELCLVIEPINSTDSDIANVLEAIVNITQKPTLQDLFGLYPNPFYNYEGSTAVSADPLLTLGDGGESDQNNPIWPFIRSERDVDVLIVNDNSADTSDNFPSGAEIYQTYLNAQAAQLTKMPTIPDNSTFISQGLNKRATFFGCNETDTVFIVYLPNTAYTYPSNQSTFKLQYDKADTDAMIANGVQIATQNGTDGWPFCLACAVKNQDGDSLPSGCDACFEKYCYYSS